MIPKKIHYCWFGRNEKPKLAKKCIASWKKYCPDYEIIEWNEDNFDLDQNDYLCYCYENKKWAFLSDLARLMIVAEQGGIYFDTDVELVRNPDELLENDAFFGFENDANVATGLGFGAVAGHHSVLAMIQQYEALQKDAEGNYPMVVCPALNTQALVPMGLQLNGQLQEFEGVTVYPADYFNPYDDPTGRLRKTENTYSIHWYSKSWMSKKTILRSKLTKPLHRLLGTDFFRKNKTGK